MSTNGGDAVSAREESQASAVTYSNDSGLGIIHISDGRGNRLNPSSLEELSRAFQEGLADEDAKLLMIRSGERSFCLGMDLEGLESSLDDDGSGGNSGGDHRSGGVKRYSSLLYSIAGCAKPVIALVEGDVKAGGVGLAAACDIVIAREDASFELSEVLFGLVPYNVLPYVFSLRMSPQRFRYMVLSAARVDAREARDFGLVDRVFSEDALEKGLKSMLKTMMRAEPRALAAAKTFFTRALDQDFDTLRGNAEQALLKHMAQPQVKEGLEAFHSGDMPEWFSRFKPGKKLSGQNG
ncbi:enoyl-CoA hydratase/isomerase family protein [Salinispira pacifica]|uniref:Methylglutaconyl-CoA hydratase n=1 Tax=Salinispira pacifica TaxID=1307761 RepID=V5WE44_9SPIO|nr:enoyl-CoA hydratase/isomerase family protein [Salinispira pacifica]AHC13849.1 Methylglutaconyl-CoA hydratase [Salinispira pacifica]